MTAAQLNAQMPSQSSGVDSHAGSPSRDLAPRIVLSVRATRIVSFDETITSVLILDPETVAAEVKDGTLVTFTALRQGETPVIIIGRNSRHTLMVEVKPIPGKTQEQVASETSRSRRAQSAPSGIYSVSFSPAFDGGPTLVRNTFDYSQQLAPGRKLRIAGDMFKFIGGDNSLTTYSAATSFGLNRLSVGVDMPTGTLDFFDSELNISPLTLSGYTMRGLHLTSTPDSRLHGLEFFAGLARPSLAFFDKDAGYLGGALLPVAHGKSWQARAGVLAFVAQRNLAGAKSGVDEHVDASYTPDERTTAEAETDFADGAFSWRARLNLQRGAFDFNGESLRFDQRSPLIGIGAQSGGRKLDSLSVGWRPSARLDARVSYSRAANVLLDGSHRATLNNSDLFASVNYELPRGSRLGLRFSQQEIETNASSLAAPLYLATRTATLTHSIRFGERWSNDFEAGLTFSSEGKASEKIERGLTVRDELRHSWERWSASAFVNYTSDTQTLVSLILRNPDVLPLPLRRAYDADPERFLTLNRDLISGLLNGIELPLTRNLDAGVRFQGAFSRYTLSGEARYGKSQISAREQLSLNTTAAVGVRLDEANSVQFSGSRASSGNATGNQSALTVSYVHRFGGGAGKGFQFSTLLGLDHGRIEGRVFFDLNGNGREDAGERGVAGMKIQLDGDRSATTNDQGRFHFSALNPDDYNVALISDELGVRLRASTATEQYIPLSARQTAKLSFGVTNTGFVSGRIFNDLYAGKEQAPTNTPGISGVHLSLRLTGTTSAPLAQTVDASGIYEFRNLAPGNYTLEIDPMTLPVDFRLPTQTSWQITVEPLRGLYLDVPLYAQRTVSGVVFMDKDGDGKFDPNIDEPLAGARVVAGQSETPTDQQGAYILRNLPAGKVELIAYAHPRSSCVTTINFAAEPAMLRAINLAVK